MSLPFAPAKLLSHWCLRTRFASDAPLYIDNIFFTQTVILHAEYYSYVMVCMQVFKCFKGVGVGGGYC